MHRFVLVISGLLILLALAGCSNKPAPDAATQAYKGPAPAVPPPGVAKKGMQNIPGAIPGGGVGGRPMAKPGG